MEWKNVNYIKILESFRAQWKKFINYNGNMEQNRQLLNTGRQKIQH